MPSSPKNGGHLLFLPDHPSFLCSWDGVDCGFGLYFLPDYNNFIVEQGRTSIGPQTKIYYPPRSGLLAITPTTEVVCIQKLAIVQPKNLSMPLLELPLPEVPSDPMNCDDLIALVMTIRESLSDPRTGSPDGNPWIVPKSILHRNYPVQIEVSSDTLPIWIPADSNSRTISWFIKSRGAKHLTSIGGTIPLPLVASGQGAPPQQALCQPKLAVSLFQPNYLPQVFCNR